MGRPAPATKPSSKDSYYYYRGHKSLLSAVFLCISIYSSLIQSINTIHWILPLWSYLNGDQRCLPSSLQIRS
ncbi:hypothetical protein BDW68DRAFT_168437 [Aspergillus falconensis]